MGERGSWRATIPRFSVRFRILASILVVTALGMTVAGATAFFVQRDRTLGEIDERLISRVESARFVVTGQSTADNGGEAVAAVPTDATFASARDALEAVLSRVIPGRNESSLGIVDSAAAFIPGVAMDFHLEEDPALVARIVDEAADGSVHLGTAHSPLGQLRYIATPVLSGASPEQAVYVTAIDVDAELTELTTSFTTYAVVAALALVAIALVGWFVAGRALRPIRQLRAAASRITASDLHERIPVTGRDDVSDLTVTVNDMLGRLDGALTSQRQLLDDVRHELKTPITILRGHLELLDASNVGEVESTRALAIDELDRMTGLVDDIESLAEAQWTTILKLPVDVADLTADVYAKATGFSGHQWKLGDAAEGTVPIQPARITQAWLQLVDNAAKYSPAGSVITIGSTRYGDSVEFWVADTGPGVPEGAEERIFERFGRADAGRGIRGSGLGLPIVATIARAHGGYVRLDSSSAGARFGLVVPADLSQPVAGGTEPVS